MHDGVQEGEKNPEYKRTERAATTTTTTQRKKTIVSFSEIFPNSVIFCVSRSFPSIPHTTTQNGAFFAFISISPIFHSFPLQFLRSEKKKKDLSRPFTPLGFFSSFFPPSCNHLGKKRKKSVPRATRCSVRKGGRCRCIGQPQERERENLFTRS